MALAPTAGSGARLPKLHGLDANMVRVRPVLRTLVDTTVRAVNVIRKDKRHLH